MASSVAAFKDDNSKLIWNGRFHAGSCSPKRIYRFGDERRELLVFFAVRDDNPKTGDAVPQCSVTPEGG
jgi:hypothetical protein